jgi:hypothetical protein
MNMGHAPKCADGGTTNYLTLLVPEGKRLRAVLKRQPLRVWTVAKWNLTDNIDACSIDMVNQAELILTLGAGSSHGWHDCPHPGAWPWPAGRRRPACVPQKDRDHLALRR